MDDVPSTEVASDTFAGLTPMQERTLKGLIGTGRLPEIDRELGARLRARLEDGLRKAGVRPGAGPLWLGKHRLNQAQRCEGLFDAGLRGEGGPFEHSDRTAAGALFHGAIEVDVATERRNDPRTVGERAASRRIQVDPSFARHWLALGELDRAELIAEAGRHLSLFRDSFPPMTRRWAPQTELTIRARLVESAVVLTGTPDLQLGRVRRLVIDFKSGRAWPEHPEDMRFYALLLLLRTGVPPYRAATFFLDSGEWQAEDVTEMTLEHAAGRVIAAARVGMELRSGRSSNLTPGAWCGWCPRAMACPVSLGRSSPERGAVGSQHWSSVGIATVR
jgi:PD-(D/E)XK nuclease superfamily